MMTFIKNPKLFPLFDAMSNKIARLLAFVSALCFLFSIVAIGRPTLYTTQTRITQGTPITLTVKNTNLKEGSMVELIDEGNPIATVSSNASGEANIILTNLAEGTHNLFVRFTDASKRMGYYILGGANSNAILVKVDKLPISDKITITKSPNLVIQEGTNAMLSGKAEPFKEICIMDITNQIGKTSADSNGDWSYSVSTYNQLGDHTLTATLCGTSEFTQKASYTVFSGGK